MSKISVSGTPRATLLIHAQPEDFRMIADKLEYALANMVDHRDHVILEISDGVNVVAAYQNKAKQFIVSTSSDDVFCEPGAYSN